MPLVSALVLLGALPIALSLDINERPQNLLNAKIVITEQMKSVVALPPDTIEFGLIKEFAGFWWIWSIEIFNFLATVWTTFVLMP